MNSLLVKNRFFIASLCGQNPVQGPNFKTLNWIVSIFMLIGPGFSPTLSGQLILISEPELSVFFEDQIPRKYTRNLVKTPPMRFGIHPDL